MTVPLGIKHNNKNNDNNWFYHPTVLPTATNNNNNHNSIILRSVLTPHTPVRRNRAPDGRDTVDHCSTTSTRFDTTLARRRYYCCCQTSTRSCCQLAVVAFPHVLAHGGASSRSPRSMLRFNGGYGASSISTANIQTVTCSHKTTTRRRGCRKSLTAGAWTRRSMAPLQGEQQQGSSRNLHLIPLHVDPPPSLSGTRLPFSSASRPLPLSLGCKQLASWWWTTCPCLGVVTRHPCRRSCRRLSRHVHSLSKEAMMVISERGRLSISGKNAMRLIKVNGKALPSPTQQPDLQLVAQDIISVGIDSPVRTDHVTEEKVDNPSRTSTDDQADNEDCRPWMRFQLLDATTTGQPIVTPELPSRFAKHSNSWLTTMTNHSRPQHAKRHSQRRIFPSVFRSTKQNELIDSLEDISSDSEGMCSNRQELPAKLY